ncbi:MAG: threonylcarbamoyl-AMP synthase [SAR202 cluster bacterium]|nr:threonylcarbamoyl-AMP synthase [SAR202 cluster bacterium]
MESVDYFCSLHGSKSECFDEIKDSANVVSNGGIIIYPTDTLYGLGADIRNEESLLRIYDIKGRPNDMALPVLVSGWEMVRSISSEVNVIGEKLAARFWPGQLTLVIRANDNLSTILTGGRGTIAVRQPDHWIAQQIIEQVGNPIVGTSANLSGSPDLVEASDLAPELGHLVDRIITCGLKPFGVGSTVVDITGEQPKLLRGTSISIEDIKSALG